MVWNLDEEGFLSKKPNPSPFLWKVETEADLSSGVLLELENVLRNEEKEWAQKYWSQGEVQATAASFSA